MWLLLNCVWQREVTARPTLHIQSSRSWHGRDSGDGQSRRRFGQPSSAARRQRSLASDPRRRRLARAIGSRFGAPPTTRYGNIAPALLVPQQSTPTIPKIRSFIIIIIIKYLWKELFHLWREWMDGFTIESWDAPGIIFRFLISSSFLMNWFFSGLSKDAWTCCF